MPEALEKKLKSTAMKKFGSVKSARARKYIYGSLRKTGWVPSTQHKTTGGKSGNLNVR